MVCTARDNLGFCGYQRWEGESKVLYSHSCVVAACPESKMLLQVLQKDATRTLSRFSLRLKVVKEHLNSRAWVSGLVLDLGGALLMVVSYALAPVRLRTCLQAQPGGLTRRLKLCMQVSVVQPVSGLGLGITAVFSHFWLGVSCCCCSAAHPAASWQ